MVRRWLGLKPLLLAATILVRYDTMEVVVYVDPDADTVAPARLVEQACDVLQSMDLDLPAPYRMQWQKELPNGAVLPDDSKVVTGMLTAANCGRT